MDNFLDNVYGQYQDKIRGQPLSSLQPRQPHQIGGQFTGFSAVVSFLMLGLWNFMQQMGYNNHDILSVCFMLYLFCVAVHYKSTLFNQLVTAYNVQAQDTRDYRVPLKLIALLGALVACFSFRIFAAETVESVESGVSELTRTPNDDQPKQTFLDELLSVGKLSCPMLPESEEEKYVLFSKVLEDIVDMNMQSCIYENVRDEDIALLFSDMERELTDSQRTFNDMERELVNSQVRDQGCEGFTGDALNVCRDIEYVMQSRLETKVKENVWNSLTPEQVAFLRKRCDEDNQAHEYCEFFSTPHTPYASDGGRAMANMMAAAQPLIHFVSDPLARLLAECYGQ